MGPGGGCWAYALTARDVFLDPQMVDAGYWRWSSPHPALPGVEGIPLTNFVGWLLVSALMVAVLSVVIGRREPASMTDRRAAELLPLVAYLWVYASSVIAHLGVLRSAAGRTGRRTGDGCCRDPAGRQHVPGGPTMTIRPRDVLRWVVNSGTALASASLVLTVSNARRSRAPDVDALPVAEPLSVLIPMRDEAANAPGCLRAVLAAIDRWPGPARIVVVDDDSTDDTAEILAICAATDPRVSVVAGTPPPAGWLGKSWACHQAAQQVPCSGVLAFVDADVRVSPFAFTATVAALRVAGLALLCPYPRQLADSPAERLIQPLLQWSWMSTLPLGIAERSSRPKGAGCDWWACLEMHLIRS